MIPCFPVDGFDTTKRQRSVCFHLAIFEIEITGYLKNNTVHIPHGTWCTVHVFTIGSKAIIFSTRNIMQIMNVYCNMQL